MRRPPGSAFCFSIARAHIAALTERAAATINSSFRIPNFKFAETLKVEIRPCFRATYSVTPCLKMARSWKPFSSLRVSLPPATART